MNGDYLLDTNIVIAMINGDAKVIAEFDRSFVSVPSIVLGELYYGIEASARSVTNLAKVESLAARVNILTVGYRTAKLFGSIKNKLRSAGTPIPDNDVWIAAMSIEHGLALVSRDAHFSYVSDLELIQW